VWEVHDRERDARLALKLLTRADGPGVYRFKKEFRAFCGLTHPNLVTLHELVSESDRWFFTMELVEGEDFSAHVRRAPERVRAVLGDVARGVCALHEAGLLHRDLKPSNVLVRPDGRVVVLDFGVGTEIGPRGLDESISREIVGTVAYMSPEQAAGLPLSPASDWYAFGAMLYEALTGWPPFLGPWEAPAGSRAEAERSTARQDSDPSGWPEIVLAKQRRDPKSPRDVRAEVPEDLDLLCMRLLARSPLGRPSAQEVLAVLGAGAPAAQSKMAAPAVHPAPPFVGRQDELKILEGALESARRGRATAVTVRGPSGIGKTALVRRFLAGVVARGEAVVLEGRCYERESVPYKGLDSLVDALSRHLARLPKLEAAELMPRDVRALARLFPVLARVDAVLRTPERRAEALDPHEARRRAFAALRELLSRMADRRPVVLAVDDLQWTDVDSAMLLGDLLTPPDAPPLLLIFVLRTVDETANPGIRLLREKLGRALTANVVHDVAVAPLARSDATAFALALSGRDDGAALARAEALAAESEGNPFLLGELVRHYREESQGPPRAISLEDVVAARLRRVPDAALSLLEVICIAGRPIAESIALRVAGGGAEAMEALAALRSASLVRAHGDDALRIETTHDRIRDVVAARLAPGRHAALHRVLAEALETTSADPQVLAGHFLAAGEPVRARRYVLAAADEAATALAFERGARLYHLALQLDAPDADGRLREKLGDARAYAGLGPEAAEAYLEAAARATGASALELRRRAAEQLLRTGHVDAGLDLLRTVLDAVGMKLARTRRRALFSLVLRRLRLWLRGLDFRLVAAGEGESTLSAEDRVRIDVCWSVVVGLTLVDHIQGTDYQTQHMLLALDSGVPFLVARALASEAGYSAVAGRRAGRRTQALLRASEEIAARSGDAYTRGFAILTAGMAAFLEGDRKQAFELHERAEEILCEHCPGAGWEVNTSRLFSLWSLCYMGKLREVGRRVPRLLDEAQARGDLYVVTSVGTGLPNMAWLAADDPDEAAERVRTAMAWRTQSGFHQPHYWKLLSEAQIDLYRGDDAAAYGRVAGAWPSIEKALLLRIESLRIEALHLRARCALALAKGRAGSERRTLLRTVAGDANRLEKDGGWGAPLARLLRAGMAALGRDAETAQSHLDAAITGFAEVHMGLHESVALRRKGEIVGGHEGRALVGAADARMQAEDVRRPERMAAMLAPGF